MAETLSFCPFYGVENKCLAGHKCKSIHERRSNFKVEHLRLCAFYPYCDKGDACAAIHDERRAVSFISDYFSKVLHGQRIDDKTNSLQKETNSRPNESKNDAPFYLTWAENEQQQQQYAQQAIVLAACVMKDNYMSFLPDKKLHEDIGKQQPLKIAKVY